MCGSAMSHDGLTVEAGYLIPGLRNCSRRRIMTLSSLTYTNIYSNLASYAPNRRSMCLGYLSWICCGTRASGPVPVRLATISQFQFRTFSHLSGNGLETTVHTCQSHGRPLDLRTENVVLLVSLCYLDCLPTLLSTCHHLLPYIGLARSNLG